MLNNIAIRQLLTNTLITILLLSNSTIAQAQSLPNSPDIVIAGAGAGGISAAVQAARLGSTVLLLEETDYIGGQISAAGVSSIDVGPDDKWNTGIYREFRDKTLTIYQGKNLATNTCWTKTCFEPNISKQVLLSMINQEPNITLALKTTITSVSKNNNQITGVTLSNGQNISTNILIDATEYGNVIPLTGANYRIGNESNTNNPTSCIQDITYAAVIKKYHNGVPSNLIIHSPPPGYESVKASFANIVTKNGQPGWPLKYPVNWYFHTTYRAMPNFTDDIPGEITKTGINWANDYHVNNAKYLIDSNYRQEINCQAKLKTIQFIYYVQHELGETSWAIANDEGYNTDWNRNHNECSNIPAELKTIEHLMPPIPYVRESVRIIGLNTVTAKNIYRPDVNYSSGATKYPSSIAIGNYGNDLHGCSDDSSLESSLSETRADISPGYGPFQIPLEALISNNIDGLIATEKNISTSRLANGATRLQPITMLTGQAAGTLASLASENNTSPKNIPFSQVQTILLDNHSLLYPFLDILTSHPYFNSIQKIALKGIMNGTGNLNFNPNNPISRAEVAVVLTKAFNLQSTTQQTISDVPPNHWAYSYIQNLLGNGITAGCATNPLRYCPDNPVTNAQAAIFAYKSWQTIDHTLTTTSPSTPTYSDVPSDHWAYPYVESLASRNVRWYCDQPANKFCPDDSITRGAITHHIIKILEHNPSPIPSPSPAPIPSDLNNDGTVNIFDYNILVAGFGTEYDIFDYNELVSNYGL